MLCLIQLCLTCCHLRTAVEVCWGFPAHELHVPWHHSQCSLPLRYMRAEVGGKSWCNPNPLSINSPFVYWLDNTFMLLKKIDIKSYTVKSHSYFCPLPALSSAWNNHFYYYYYYYLWFFLLQRFLHANIKILICYFPSICYTHNLWIFLLLFFICICCSSLFIHVTQSDYFHYFSDVF